MAQCVTKATLTEYGYTTIQGTPIVSTKTEVTTSTLEPFTLYETNYRCVGCKGSGGPDYCPTTYMAAIRTDQPCSYWETTVTSTVTGGGETTITNYIPTTTYGNPITSSSPTATQFTTSCSQGGGGGNKDTTSSSSTSERQQQQNTPSPSPSTPAQAGGSTPAAASQTPALVSSTFTSVASSTSFALSAIQVTVTANGTVFTQTSTSSIATVVNATVIGNVGGLTDTATTNGKSTPVGAIAGGVAGGVIAIIGLVLFLWWRRRKAKNDSEQGGAGGNGYWNDDDMGQTNAAVPVVAQTYRATGANAGAALLEDKDETHHVDPYVPAVGYGATPVPEQQYGGYVNSAESARNEKAQLMASYAANDAVSQASGSGASSGYPNAYTGSTVTEASSQPVQQQAFSPTSPTSTNFNRTSVYSDENHNPLAGFVVPGQGHSVSQSSKISGVDNQVAGAPSSAGGPSNAVIDEGVDSPPLYSPTA